MSHSSRFLGSITKWLNPPLFKKRRRKQKKQISTAEIKVASFTRTAPDLYVSPIGNNSSTDTLSCLCTHSQLDSSVFRRWAHDFGEGWRVHRKLWELCYICETLSQRGMLQHGKKGLGFAVGLERLPSFFASKGCEILASDLPAKDSRKSAWAATGQWAPNLEALNQYGLCQPAIFKKLVSFRPIDMNRIPEDIRGFDFTWSTCSFEHCGNLELGLRFLENQMNCLKPGGLAVHTTEFNLSSNSETISRGTTVIYRLKDIEEICLRLKDQGHIVEPIDLQTGSHKFDCHIDGPPYSPEPHLRLDIRGFATTSIGLVIRKGTAYK